MWPMCVCSIWVSPQVLVSGLGEVPRVLTDGPKTPWHRSLNPEILVIGKTWKTSGRWRNSSMYKLSNSIVPKWGVCGLTVALMIIYTDEGRRQRSCSVSRDILTAHYTEFLSQTP